MEKKLPEKGFLTKKSQNIMLFEVEKTGNTFQTFVYTILWREIQTS